MDTARTCPHCGKTLPTDAPQGVCPECLLKAGLATETGGRDTPGRPRFIPPTTEMLARHFPQLEILNFVGQGGMGAVYRARQKQIDRIVALKILPPQAAAGPGFAERFTREVRALAKLNHPHIVTLYEFGQSDGLFYFLMEFVDGLNLQQLLQAGRIAPNAALAIVPQICDALQFAHQRGIVHRDIKPGNILLSKEGQVKIADFGVAKIVAEGLDETAAGKAAAGSGELTEAGSVLGTPQYMAPEQLAHPLEVDHRADIYSLGVVFYQMLTGELPTGKFEAPSKKVVVDMRLDEVVLRALEREPELRYQQASQLKTQVETIVATPPSGSSRGNEARTQKAEVGGRRPERMLNLLASAPGRLRYGLVACLIGLPAGIMLKLPFVWGLSIAGLVIGTAKLLSLNGTATSDKEDRHLVTSAATGMRFSRTAIVAAAWLTFSIILELLFALDHAQAHGQTADSYLFTLDLQHFSLGKLVLLSAMLLAHAGVIGGTVLGWVAVSQIRRSAGKLYGLWLGVFDGLVFPLLALDVGIFLLGALIVEVLQEVRINASPMMVALSFVGSLAADYIIVRAAWHAVNKTNFNSDADQHRATSAPTTKEPRSLQQVIKSVVQRFALATAGTVVASETFNRISVHWKESEQELWIPLFFVFWALLSVWAAWPWLHRRRTFLGWAAGLGAITVIFFAVWATNAFYGWIAPTLGLSRQPDWVFEPVHINLRKDRPLLVADVEASLGSLTREGRNRFYDLDRDRIVTPPREYSGWPQLRKQEWLRESGVDLMLSGGPPSPWRLLTPVENAIELIKAPAGFWEKGRHARGLPAERFEKLYLIDAGVEVLALALSERPTHPTNTFEFQTANGAAGLLRIGGINFDGGDEPIELKLRYRKYRSAPAAETVLSADPLTVWDDRDSVAQLAQSSSKGNQEPTVVPPVIVVAAGTNRARLPNGSEIELTTVAHTQDGRTTWWNADGSLLETPPGTVITPTTWDIKAHRRTNDFFALIVRVTPDGTRAQIYVLDPPVTTRSTGQLLRDGVQVTADVPLTFAYLDPLKPAPGRINLRFGAAIGPTRTVARFDGSLVTVTGVTANVRFQTPIRNGPDTILRVECPPELRDCWMAASARQKNGRWADAFDPSDAVGTPERQFHFSNLSPSDVADYVVEFVPWYWVEFRNVALSPQR